MNFFVEPFDHISDVPAARGGSCFRNSVGFDPISLSGFGEDEQAVVRVDLAEEGDVVVFCDGNGLLPTRATVLCFEDRGRHSLHISAAGHANQYVFPRDQVFAGDV